MIQQTIFEYQSFPPFFIGPGSLGIEDFAHNPHEIFFRGSQIFDESIESRVFPLGLLPAHHL